MNNIENKSESPLDPIVDFATMRLKTENLSQRQKQFAHLIDPRFFAGGKNYFRHGKKRADYVYTTLVDLEEELFYLHPFMDPQVLEQGNVRRFPSGINEKYICEKYFEDKWVSEGNNELAIQLESYVLDNLEKLKQKDRITLLDIGPCGGAITTLFALRALNKFGLLSKVNLALLDIVPNVLEATLLGKFIVPDELIKEYGLEFLGSEGEKYKQFLGSGVLHDVREWYELHTSNKPTAHTGGALFLSEKNRNNNNARVHYYRGDGETLPKELNNIDIVLSAYTHHHMNLFGRQSLCRQMEQAACAGGFVGVADFYVPTYEDYMAWYKPHFQKYGDAPPVECPLIDGKTLAGWFEKTKINQTKELQRTVVFSGVKK